MSSKDQEDGLLLQSAFTARDRSKTTWTRLGGYLGVQKIPSFVHVQGQGQGRYSQKKKARLSPRSYEMIPPATRPSYSERTNVELVHSVGFHNSFSQNFDSIEFLTPLGPPGSTSIVK